MSLLVMIGVALAMWAVLALIGGERDREVRELEAARQKAKERAEAAQREIPVLGSPKSSRDRKAA